MARRARPLLESVSAWVTVRCYNEALLARMSGTALDAAA
jgi:hypothetical protein